MTDFNRNSYIQLMSSSGDSHHVILGPLSGFGPKKCLHESGSQPNFWLQSVSDKGGTSVPLW